MIALTGFYAIMSWHNLPASYLFIFFLKIYSFLAALGLLCCLRAFPSCGEQRLLFLEVCGLLIAIVSLVAAPRPQSTGSAVVVQRLSYPGILLD